MSAKFNIGDSVYLRGMVCEVVNIFDYPFGEVLYMVRTVNFNPSPALIEGLWIPESDICHYPLLEVECDFE